jgi:hypothetical protein
LPDQRACGVARRACRPRGRRRSRGRCVARRERARDGGVEPVGLVDWRPRTWGVHGHMGTDWDITRSISRRSGQRDEARSGRLPVFEIGAAARRERKTRHGVRMG